MWDDDLVLGVCAKTFKSGDVAWHCADCEMDPTCIICSECFENSDHEGHRTALITGVSGCCDCGDPEAWDMKGACVKHKGIDSSKEDALSALAPSIREKAPAIFKSLTKILKTCLLGLLMNQDKVEVSCVYETMIMNFIEETNTLLQSWKQCIFFLSEAYTEIFYGSHPVKDGDGWESNHECCYRYFPSDHFKSEFLQAKALVEFGDGNVTEGERYCTCTVIDLLF